MTQDFSLRTSPTFIDAVYTFGNAISDSAVVILGGSCIYERIEQTFCQMDYAQTLLNHDHNHRIISTYTDQTVSTMGTEKFLESTIQETAKRLKPSLILVTELTMIAMMGEDFNMLIERLSKKIGIPIIKVSSFRLGRDFGDAVTSFIEGLITFMPEMSKCHRKSSLKNTVGIVGNIFERGEGEQEGNIHELHTMLSDIGLHLLPVWFSKSTFSDILNMQKAQTLIAFPFAHPSAEILSKKITTPLLQLELPVGISGTQKWLMTLASRTGMEKKARAAIKQKLRDVIPRIDRVATRHLAGKRAAIVATREWLNGLSVFFEEDLGIAIPLKILRQRFNHDGTDGMEMGVDRLFDPSVASLEYHISMALSQGGLDFVVGSGWERNVLRQKFPDLPFLEFGYPYLKKHYLNPTPFLGFTGAVTWAEQITNLLSASNRF